MIFLNIIESLSNTAIYHNVFNSPNLCSMKLIRPLLLLIHVSCKLNTKGWVRLMDPWFKINSSWQTVYHIRYMNNHIPLTLTYLGWSQNVLWFGSFPRLFIIIVLPRFIQKNVLEIWISKIKKSWLTISKILISNLWCNFRRNENDFEFESNCSTVRQLGITEPPKITAFLQIQILNRLQNQF